MKDSRKLGLTRIRFEPKTEKYFLLVLILLLFVVNYPFLDNALKGFLEDYEVGIVERVIDGDTVVIGNDSIRLLGINSPEKGDLYYNEAKDFLELMVLNRTIKLVRGKEDRDMYNRKLRYLLIGTTNLNKELIKEGLANYYFLSGKDVYYREFKEAWEECIKKDKNLCEASEIICSDCIMLKELNHKDQEVLLYNSCSFTCNLKDWTIKDEGRKKFTFPNFDLESNNELIIKVEKNETKKDTGDVLLWKRSSYVWTDTGDTLFLRDSDGKLVLWESY